MKTMLSLCIFSSILVISLFADDTKEASSQKIDVLSQLQGNEGILSFGNNKCYIQLPDNYSTASKSPLILFFHGRGGSAAKSNFTTPDFANFRKKAAAKGYIVAVPGYGSDCWFNADAEKITLQMIDFLAKNISCETERFFVMGCSMGGGAALTFTARHPEKVKAVCDIFGITDFTRFYNDGFYNASISKAYGGSPSERPDYYRNQSAINLTAKYKGIPFLILHGDRDRCVPKWNSDTLVDKMQKENINVKYIQIKGVGHENRIVINQEDNILKFFDDFSK